MLRRLSFARFAAVAAASVALSGGPGSFSAALGQPGGLELTAPQNAGPAESPPLAEPTPAIPASFDRDPIGPVGDPLPQPPEFVEDLPPVPSSRIVPVRPTDDTSSVLRPPARTMPNDLGTDAQPWAAPSDRLRANEIPSNPSATGGRGDRTWPTTPSLGGGDSLDSSDGFPWDDDFTTQPLSPYAPWPSEPADAFGSAGAGPQSPGLPTRRSFGASSETWPAIPPRGQAVFHSPWERSPGLTPGGFPGPGSPYGTFGTFSPAITSPAVMPLVVSPLARPKVPECVRIVRHPTLVRTNDPKLDPIPVALVVDDPCTPDDRPLVIPMLLPGSACDPPKIDGGKCLLGLGHVWFRWETGFRIKVVFHKSGDVVVHVHGR